METRATGIVAPGSTEGDGSASPPPVVAVMVTSTPGPWFEAALEALGSQAYPDLSILVADAASASDPTPRVARVLPQAFVHRLAANEGFGAAVNEAIGTVSGAEFYLVCHDDVALEPNAVQRLINEARRSDADVVGPKLVDWHEPRRLLQVGMNADKTGAVMPKAERGELDQSQHDAVRDVFAVPGGCTLIRAELFDRLGGYDAGINFLGDDLDLCWRSHVAGARVVIATDAVARHVEALADRRPTDDRRRLLARHRLRTMLGSYSFVSLLRVVPQALCFTVMEATYALLTGRVDQARDVVGAWPWNLRRLRQLWRKRRALRKVRAVPDREVRALQQAGSARLNGFLSGQLGREDDHISPWAPPAHPHAGVAGGSPGSRARAMVAVGLLVALVLAGSRNLLIHLIPAVGDFARFPARPGSLLSEWTSGWRTAGLGSNAPAPTAFGVLGVLGTVLRGSMGLLRHLAILATLPIGVLGAWRSARPIGSRRSTAVALAVYIAVPVPYNALAHGSWTSLAAYAAAPWLLFALARASRLAPFGQKCAGPVGSEATAPKGDAAISSRPGRLVVRQTIALGVVVAAAGAMVPFVVVVVLAMASALALGSLVACRVTGVGRIVAVAVGSCVVATVLHLPWSLEFLGGSTDWATFVGARGGVGGPHALGQILRFQSGPFGATPLGWALLVVAAPAVLVGRSWRLEWAVRAWFVALVGWSAVWAHDQGWLPSALPPAEVLLAPAAAALALASAFGVAALEVDLRNRRSGFRKAFAGATVVALAVGVLPLFSGLVDGRWSVPRRDFTQSLDPLFEPTGRVPYRTLWMGDARVLPLAGWRLDDQIAYATASHGVPDITNVWAGPEGSATAQIARSVRTAEDGGTGRLGRLLAPMGIRYIVVPSRLAPGSGDRRPPPGRLLDALAEQLDLQEVPAADDVTVYRNRAWFPTGAVLPRSDRLRRSFVDAATEDLTSAEPALTRFTGPTSATGVVPAAGDLFVSQAFSPNWELAVNGRVVRHRRLYRWANGFDVQGSGSSPDRASLTYRTPQGRRWALAGQAVLWMAALMALIRLRPRRRRTNAQKRR